MREELLRPFLGQEHALDRPGDQAEHHRHDSDHDHGFDQAYAAAQAATLAPPTNGMADRRISFLLMGRVGLPCRDAAETVPVRKRFRKVRPNRTAPESPAGLLIAAAEAA